MIKERLGTRLVAMIKERLGTRLVAMIKERLGTRLVAMIKERLGTRLVAMIICCMICEGTVNTLTSEHYGYPELNIALIRHCCASFTNAMILPESCN